MIMHDNRLPVRDAHQLQFSFDRCLRNASSAFMDALEVHALEQQEPINHIVHNE
jgi:hypothetical protein